jgi:amino acid transporter
MSLKQFTSLVGGFILTGLIYVVITFILVFFTFSLGNQTLTEKENKDTFLFYTASAISIITIYLIFRRLKTNKKFSAIGICVALFISFYGTFNLAKVYFENLNYYEEFDTLKWTNSEHKPFKMAKTLTNNRTLLGLTKQQVIEKLGTTNETLKNNKFNFDQYWTDKGTWQLRLYYKEDKVIEAYLYEEGVNFSD